MSFLCREQQSKVDTNNHNSFYLPAETVLCLYLEKKKHKGSTPQLAPTGHTINIYPPRGLLSQGVKYLWLHSPPKQYVQVIPDSYTGIAPYSQWRCSTCGTLLPATSVHLEHLHTGQERSPLSTIVYTRHSTLLPCSPQLHFLPNNSCTVIMLISRFSLSTRRCEE